MRNYTVSLKHNPPDGFEIRRHNITNQVFFLNKQNNKIINPDYNKICDQIIVEEKTGLIKCMYYEFNNSNISLMTFTSCALGMTVPAFITSQGWSFNLFSATLCGMLYFASAFTEDLNKQNDFDLKTTIFPFLQYTEIDNSLSGINDITYEQL